MPRRGEGGARVYKGVCNKDQVYREEKKEEGDRGGQKDRRGE